MESGQKTWIGFQGATIGYEKNRPLYQNLNLHLPPGEMTAIVGPNGSGKTALIRTLLGLNPLLNGERYLFGHRMPVSNAQAKALDGQVGYVPQKPQFQKGLPITVDGFLSLKKKMASKTWRDQLFEQLNLVPSMAKQSLHELSGGELQKIMMVFAFLSQPKLIVFDEASEGLDLKSQESLFRFLKNYISEQKATVVSVSHDISAVTDSVDRVICVQGAVLFDGSPKSQEFHLCLHKIYGEGHSIHDHRH